MSFFSDYAKRAKAAAARTPLAMTSEAEPLVAVTEEAPEVAEEPAVDEVPVVVEEPVVDDVVIDAPVEDVPAVVEEPIVEEPVVEEPIVVEEPVIDAPVDVPVEDVPVVEEPVEEPVVETPAEDAFVEARNRLNQTHHNLIRGRSQIVAEDEETIVVEPEPAAEEPAVVEEPEVSDEVVDAPVEDVPADGEVPEEPALDVTAEEDVVIEDAPVVEEPAVADEPVVDEEGVVPADVIEEDGIDITIDEDDAEVEMSPEAEAIADEQAIETLEQEMEVLTQSMFAVETYGINPTAVAIMRTTGLLEGTAIASLGLEAFGYEAPDHPESQMAIEALGDKIKEKAAQWSAKVVSLASNVGTKAMTVLNALWDKITGSIATLGSASWDAAKAAGKTVRAHPYKTIIGVILAVAAAAGVVIYGAQYLPAVSAKQPQVMKFVSDITAKINKIKWPFGNITATVAEGGAKIKTVITTTSGQAEAVALGALDWTGTMVKSAGSQLGRAWTATKQGVNAFGTRATKIGSSISKGVFETVAVPLKAGDKIGGIIAKRTGNQFAGAVGGAIAGNVMVSAIISTIITITKLVYRVIIGGLRIIAATFSALIGGTRTAAA